MSAPVYTPITGVEQPAGTRRGAMGPVVRVFGVCLIAGIALGTAAGRATAPRARVTVAAAQRSVQAVLRDDYGLADASSTTCEDPEQRAGTTFTCTARTSTVESGTVTVTVTVLNDSSQLSVGAPR